MKETRHSDLGSFGNNGEGDGSAEPAGALPADALPADGLPGGDSAGSGLPGEWDDDPWDVFLPDNDPADPLPEPGDFWIERES